MSAYTEQVLVDKLRLLSDSQQSIQTLSHWIMYHRKRHQTSVEIWKRELFKAPKDRRLLFLWLANDIVQTSRKKGNEFVKEFGKILEPCVSYVYSDSDDKVKKQILRMLDIWVERNVYQKEFITALKDHLNKASRPPAIVDHASTIMTESNLPMQTYRETPISKAMRELEEAAIAQDLSAEKVSGLREGLLDGSILGHVSTPQDVVVVSKELDEASHVLDQHKKSLEGDLERRGNFITMLTECIVQQENTMNQTTNLLQDCLQKLAQVEELRNTIKGRFSSLLQKNAATRETPTAKESKGPATPPGEPPVDDEDDVILDVTATNPYKKQKLLAPSSSTTVSSSSSSDSSVSLATTDGSLASAALAGTAYHPQSVPPLYLSSAASAYPSLAPASTPVGIAHVTMPMPLSSTLPHQQPGAPLSQWSPSQLSHPYGDYGAPPRP